MTPEEQDLMNRQRVPSTADMGFVAQVPAPPAPVSPTPVTPQVPVAQNPAEATNPFADPPPLSVNPSAPKVEKTETSAITEWARSGDKATKNEPALLKKREELATTEKDLIDKQKELDIKKAENAFNAQDLVAKETKERERVAAEEQQKYLDFQKYANEQRNNDLNTLKNLAVPVKGNPDTLSSIAIALGGLKDNPGESPRNNSALEIVNKRLDNEYTRAANEYKKKIDLIERSDKINQDYLNQLKDNMGLVDINYMNKLKTIEQQALVTAKAMGMSEAEAAAAVAKLGIDKKFIDAQLAYEKDLRQKYQNSGRSGGTVTKTESGGEGSSGQVLFGFNGEPVGQLTPSGGGTPRDKEAASKAQESIAVFQSFKSLSKQLVNSLRNGSQENLPPINGVTFGNDAQSRNNWKNALKFELRKLYNTGAAMTKSEEAAVDAMLTDMVDSMITPKTGARNIKRTLKTIETRVASNIAAAGGKPSEVMNRLKTPDERERESMLTWAKTKDIKGDLEVKTYNIGGKQKRMTQGQYKKLILDKFGGD